MKTFPDGLWEDESWLLSMKTWKWMLAGQDKSYHDAIHECLSNNSDKGNVLWCMPVQTVNECDNQPQDVGFN